MDEFTKKQKMAVKRLLKFLDTNKLTWAENIEILEFAIISFCLALEAQNANGDGDAAIDFIANDLKEVYYKHKDLDEFQKVTNRGGL